MKIAFFTESLPPNTDGVAHTYAKLAETLLNKGIEFKFYSSVVPDPGFVWRDRVRKVPSFAFPLYDYYRMGIPDSDVMRAELDTFLPDIVQCASPTPLGFFAASYARTRCIPAVTSYHTNFVSYLKYYGLQLAENIGWAYLRWFHNKFQTTYAPTSKMLDELRCHGIENIDLWQRGIEVDRFSPDLRSAALRESVGAADKPIILFVGRLVREKDLLDLADAALLLKSKKVDFKLVYVGEGPLEGELRERFPDAYFTGFLHGNALATWYASADIFAFPSTTETFGNVIQEASASGLPTVCVDQGGVVDLVNDNETGFISHANNPQDLASDIRYLIDHPEIRLQMGEKARQNVITHTWDNINGRLLNSYNEVISRYRKSLSLRKAA
jgi:glycosyltransferase involved in cell wall biosynthesis